MRKRSLNLDTLSFIWYNFHEMEGSSVSILPIELGSRLRALRKERRLSLEQLAGKSGVALATLSRIENGKGTGTFRTHQRIAEALGLSLPELYRDLRPQDTEAVLLDTEQEEAETFTYDEKASAIFLVTQVSGRQMLPQMLILQPGGQTTLEQYSSGTERWIFGLEGTVEVTVGTKSYRITTGGTLYFKASLPHRFGNQGQAMAKVISITSPVAF